VEVDQARIEAGDPHSSQQEGLWEAMSKFGLDVLRKWVYPFTCTDDPEVIRGAEFGEDVSLTRVGGDILASHVDPIVGAMKGIGRLAVHVACNDIAASGVPPRWILLLVMLPSPKEPWRLEAIMKDARQAAEEVGASIIGGHTGWSSGITRPLVAATAMGIAGERRVLGAAGARPGDHVLVTKGVGLEGTAILASDFADVARKLGLNREARLEACALAAKVSVLPEALLLADHGATAMHDVTRGGLVEALLEIAFRSGVGMEVEVDLIPMPAEVLRFAQAFDFDPLRMISSGTLTATVPEAQVRAATQAVEGENVRIQDVGRVIEGRGVRLRYDDEMRELFDPAPEEDELARMWQIYPREG
jgi:hydrogenase expression/formation protein HypE